MEDRLDLLTAKLCEVETDRERIDILTQIVIELAKQLGELQRKAIGKEQEERNNE